MFDPRRSLVLAALLLTGLMAATFFVFLAGSSAAAPVPLSAQLAPTPPLSLPSSGVMTPSTFIDICTQHAPKCSLDPAHWPGDEGEWQYTAKRWVKHTGTPPGRDVIWEWSMPYAGTNLAYVGHRENHYADFSSNPTGSPSFASSVDPYTYDWERWIPEADNLRWMQMGGADESISMLVGQEDCAAGAYYPVVDHTTPWAYTDLHATQFTQQCGGGGYVLTLLDQAWGDPLSEERVLFCDNPRTGIPSAENVLGNAVCKLSPYVGRAQQRYALGPVADKAASVGCEVVVYAWGWDHQPTAVASGQDYEAYFRNGELRFSRWYNLSNVAQGVIPDPFDDSWWNPQCDLAWTGITNAVYSGIFKIGPTVYTDSIRLPLSTGITVTEMGGTVTQPLAQVVAVFPPGSFTETVTVTLALGDSGEIHSAFPLQEVERAFALTAHSAQTGEPRQVALPFTLSVGYADYALGLVDASSVGLYRWDGAFWQEESSGQLALEANRVTATADALGEWALLGQPRRLFLPDVQR